MSVESTQLILDGKKGRALGDYRMFNIENAYSEIVFKASYIVLGDAISQGDIIANFDLVVIGKIEARNVEVKGKLTCFGGIKAERVTASEIVTTRLEASHINSREGITAQEVEADEINCEGNILVGKDITVEDLVETDNSIICGGGLYTYGKVKARTVMAVDNIEVQEDNLEFMQEPLKITGEPAVSIAAEGFSDYETWKKEQIKAIEKFVVKGDWKGLEKFLKEKELVDFARCYLDVIKAVENNPIKPFSNASGDIKFISLVDFLRLHKAVCEVKALAQNDSVFDMYCKCLDLLEDLIKTKKFDRAVMCLLESYAEFVEMIDIIQKYGTKIGSNNELLVAIIDAVYKTALGINAAYLNEKFTKRGWKINE